MAEEIIAVEGNLDELILFFEQKEVKEIKELDDVHELLSEIKELNIDKEDLKHGDGSHVSF